MKAHALLSASGSHRWLHCTPSARLEAQLPEKISEYADFGTLAHDIAANELMYRFKQVSELKYRIDFNKLTNLDIYKPDMMYHIKNYIDVCMDEVLRAKAKGGDATVLIEHRFDVSRWIPEGFGTSDFNIAYDGCLTVLDLKFGEGVPVSATENTQLMIYALGIYEYARYMYDISRIKMKIVQPRIDNTNEWELSADELLEWAESVLKPQAEKAHKGIGDFKPGEHCRFCRAKPTCAALAAYNSEMAGYDFVLPELLTEQQIAEIIVKSDLFINWINSVKDYALLEARKGRQFPGLKLVKGRSNRIIKSPENALKWLKTAGYKPDAYQKVVPVVLGELEKLLKPAHRKEFEKRFIIKPEGAPTLVPITDKRPAIGSAGAAAQDFEHLNFE